MSSTRSFRFPRRWLGYLSMALIFATACLMLSNWQFARRTEAATRVQLVATNYDKAAVPLSQLAHNRADLDRSTLWSSAVVHGHYLPQFATLVRNRVLDNEVGFETLVPFMLSSGEVVVIDRGWIAAGTADQPASPAPTTSAEPITLVFRIRATEPQITGQASTTTSLPTLNVAHYAQRWAAPTYTALYGDLVSETPAAGSHGTLSPKPQYDEGNHLSYAFQWIAFAVLGFVALAWIIRRELRLAAQEQTAKVRSRRANRDDTDEDALIDAQLNR